MQTTTYGRKWRAPPMPLLPHDRAKGHIKRTYRTMPPLLRLDSSGEVSSVDRRSFKEAVLNPNPTDLGNGSKPFRSRCNMRNWVKDRLFSFNTVSNGNNLQKGLWKNNLEYIENLVADESQFSTFPREPVTPATSDMSRVPYINPNGKWLPQCGFNGWYYGNGPFGFNHPQGSYGLFPCHQFKNMYDMPCQTSPVSNDLGGVLGYRSQFQPRTMSFPFSPVFGSREIENPTDQWGKCRKMGRQHEKTNNWQCGHRQNRHTDRRDRKHKTSPCESVVKTNSENLEINSPAITNNQNQCTKCCTSEELVKLHGPVHNFSACNTAIAEKSDVFRTHDLESDGSFINSNLKDPVEEDSQTLQQSKKTKPSDDNSSNLPHKQQFENKVAHQLENMDEDTNSFSDCVNRVDGIKGSNCDSSVKSSDKSDGGTSSPGNVHVLFIRKNVKKGRPSSKKQRKRKRQKAKNSGDGESVVITVEESSYGDADIVCTETNAVGTNNEKHLECCLKNTDKKQFGCNSLSFILGRQPEDTSPKPCGSPNTNFMTFTFSDEEGDEDSFDDEVDIGADFSQYDLFNFLPKCQGANNPLNFKVHISSVPSADSDDSGKNLDAINMSWNIEFSIRDVDQQKTKTKKKQVHFVNEKNLATIHPMIAWSYAYRASRKGPWEGFARDRERFRRRIVDAEILLQPVFQPTKRCLIYNMYYKSTAEES